MKSFLAIMLMIAVLMGCQRQPVADPNINLIQFRLKALETDQLSMKSNLAELYGMASTQADSSITILQEVKELKKK